MTAALIVAMRSESGARKVPSVQPVAVSGVSGLGALIIHPFGDADEESPP